MTAIIAGIIVSESMQHTDKMNAMNAMIFNILYNFFIIPLLSFKSTISLLHSNINTYFIN